MLDKILFIPLNDPIISLMAPENYHNNIKQKGFFAIHHSIDKDTDPDGTQLLI